MPFDLLAVIGTVTEIPGLPVPQLVEEWGNFLLGGPLALFVRFWRSFEMSDDVNLDRIREAAKVPMRLICELDVFEHCGAH
jgi:hypothetical protein